MRPHIQLQRKTSPLTTLNAWSCAASGVVAAQSRWRASWRASVMSVRPFHCAAEPGKAEGPARLAAERRVDRQRRAHVHGVADRLADHRVRPVDAPGEAVARGGGEDLVLLRVVEVLDVEPALLLAERRLRQRALAVGLERPEIVLEAR